VKTLVLWILFSNILNAKPLCEGCNVILIAADAMQAAHVHHLGYNKQTTPVLDRLSARSAVFTQAISPSSWTVPTYLSIFSSMYPSAHGLTNRYQTFSANEKTLSNFIERKPEILTLAQIYKAHGYRTGAFTGDSGLSAVLGYNKGFEVYADDIPFGGLANSAKHALAWLDGVGENKFLLFVQGYDSHGQFAMDTSATNPFWQRSEKVRFKGTKEEQAQLRELGLAGKLPDITDAEVDFWRAWYDQKIFNADAQIGKLLEELERRGLLKKAVVVFFSDHGTEFYEHKHFDHGHSLYDELVHVPLMFSLPGSKSPKVFQSQVGTINILPTLLDLTGIPATSALKKQMQGRSLAKALQSGQWPGEDVFSETDYRGYTHKRSLRTSDGWKYVMTLESGQEELYDLHVDPKESQNKALVEKSMLAKLKAKLQKHLTQMPIVKNQTSPKCLPVYPGQCE
jgi:choline-sulfatase